MIRFCQRDERGITHLLLLAAGFGLFAVVIITGIVVFNHGKSSKDTIGITTAFSECLSKNNNDNHLCTFQKDYIPINQNAYTATVNVTSPQGTLSNLTFNSDGKGDSQVVGTSNGQQLSSIVLGTAIYIKISGSGWIEYASNATNAPAQTDPTASMNIAVGQPNLSFQYVGTEACGSLSCYRYTIGDKSQPDASQTIWFDTTDYKLREWTYHGDTGSTSMTINYQPVTITAPSPVKVVSS